MPDFPIDPELRIRASPPVVLRRTTEAVGFIRKMTLNRPGNAWRELLLEAEGLLIEERTAQTSPIGQDRFRAA